MPRATRTSLCTLLLLAYAPQRSHELLVGVRHATRPAAARVLMMGRKFENNKLKMAKTALAYAKKASYIGKKVVVAVKAGGDDPGINRQLAAVMAEVSARALTLYPIESLSTLVRMRLIAGECAQRAEGCRHQEHQTSNGQRHLGLSGAHVRGVRPRRRWDHQ